MRWCHWLAGFLMTLPVFVVAVLPWSLFGFWALEIAVGCVALGVGIIKYVPMKEEKF